jgi:trehalose/maltose transport system substrate-binding protein
MYFTSKEIENLTPKGMKVISSYFTPEELSNLTPADHNLLLAAFGSSRPFSLKLAASIVWGPILFVVSTWLLVLIASSPSVLLEWSAGDRAAVVYLLIIAMMVAMIEVQHTVRLIWPPLRELVTPGLRLLRQHLPKAAALKNRRNLTWGVRALSVFTIVISTFVAPTQMEEDKTKPQPVLSILPLFTHPLEDNPPPVPNASAARPPSGLEITYQGDSVGQGHEIDVALAKRFEEQTGVHVRVVPKPRSATESFANYRSQFQGKIPGADVYLLDMVWSSIFASNLRDLSGTFGTPDKLVAVDWFDDFGVLYYRSDLLQKYGYSQPPQTWADLEEMARTIQAGERPTNPNFWGWIWQGAAYEGLTTDALEWLASQGGGTIISANGEVTINNAAAVQALNRARGWITPSNSAISPPEVTFYTEEDAREMFQQGNAVFMRNWPYVDALLKDSPLAGKFGVAPLPHGPDQPSVSTVGGGQLGVSQSSQHPEAAIEFVRYLTSPEVQKWRAEVGSYIPADKALWNDPEVSRALPFLANFNVNSNRIQLVTRPSTVAGANYPQVSASFFLAVSRILFGADAAEVLPQLEQDLKRLLLPSNSAMVYPPPGPFDGLQPGKLRIVLKPGLSKEVVHMNVF